MASIEQARKDVDRCISETLASVEAAPDAIASEAERRVWAHLLELGKALMTLFLAYQSAQWARTTRGEYRVDSATYAVVGHETAELGTLFGKVQFQRPVGRLVGAPRARRDLPLDRQLDLPGGFTMPVVALLAKLCAHMAFAPARALMKGLLGWTPSPRATLRIVDAVGGEARTFLEQAPPPDDDGEVLVISVDGKGAPAISSTEYARRARPHGGRDDNRRHQRRRRRKQRPRPRRAPGKKSKNAKMAAIGVLYTLRRNEDGRLEGPINKRVYATFESYRALFEWLHAEAVRRGYGTSKLTKVLFVADGAEVLWSLKKEFFADADECLDWFHAVEKLWAAGKAICRGARRERKRLEDWVREQKQRLRRGHVADVLATIALELASTPMTGPGNKFRRETLSSVAGYFRNNQERMQYARLRRLDLDIGSGVIEGAVRHLVGVRLDGPGMRWGRDRAEAILHLRCVLINGLWSDFEPWLENRCVRLAAQPVPVRTHDAVTKLAA